MGVLANIIFGLASTIALVSVLHNLYCMTTKPSMVLMLWEKSKKQKTLSLYHTFVLLGWFVIFYSGIKTLLFWIPDSIGGHVKDGEYQTLKSYISVIIAVFSTQILLNFSQKYKNRRDD